MYVKEMGRDGVLVLGRWRKAKALGRVRLGVTPLWLLLWGQVTGVGHLAFFHTFGSASLFGYQRLLSAHWWQGLLWPPAL